MRYTCPTCGSITDHPHGCPRHRPVHRTNLRSPRRDDAAQKRFRRAVLKRDCYRCTHVDPQTGQRCTTTIELRACHIIPFAAYLNPDHAWDINNGRTLCAQHDHATDRYANPPQPPTPSPTSTQSAQRTHDEQQAQRDPHRYHLY